MPKSSRQWPSAFSQNLTNLVTALSIGRGQSLMVERVYYFGTIKKESSRNNKALVANGEMSCTWILIGCNFGAAVAQHYTMGNLTRILYSFYDKIHVANSGRVWYL
jgi:hypothetical protein